MEAGQLTEKLLIETRSVTPDALGQDVESWSTHSEPYAKVMETPGREFLSGDYKAESKVVFRVRFRTLDSTARVTWNGRVYRINDITGTRRDGWSYLHCVATDGAN